MIAAAQALWMDLTTFHHLTVWLESIRSLDPILILAVRMREFVKELPRVGRYALGALGFKEEAAGKVRVFALVDCFTQWALAPLHDA